MKKTLLIALLLIPFLGISQTTKPIEGFLGIKFGTSKADVIAAIKAKGGLLDKSSTDKVLFFGNVSLGHRTSQTLLVKMFNDKAYFAALFFKPENDASAIPYYDSLINDITGAYGKGKSTRSFKGSYTDGDGYEAQAISLGEGNLFTDWVSGKYSIQATINTKLMVILMYQDDETNAQAVAAEKAKEKSDF